MKLKHLQRIFLTNLLIIISAVSICLILPVISVAECIEGNCVNGRGTYRFSSGAKFEGEFKAGKFHGRGTFSWPDGTKLFGNWKDNINYGQGTKIWADGAKYVGGFKKGKMHGSGTITYTSGNKYVGELKDNKRNGFGIFTYSSGKKLSGMFKNGKIVVRCDKSFFTYFNDGNNYLKQANYDAAIDNFSEITIGFDPALYYMAQNNLGVALINKGSLYDSALHFKRLISELENASKNNIQSRNKLLFYSYYNRAIANFKQNNKAGAKRNLLKAKEAYPGEISKMTSMEPLYITDTDLR